MNNVTTLIRLFLIICFCEQFVMYVSNFKGLCLSVCVCVCVFTDGRRNCPDGSRWSLWWRHYRRWGHPSISHRQLHPSIHPSIHPSSSQQSILTPIVSLCVFFTSHRKQPPLCPSHLNQYISFITHLNMQTFVPRPKTDKALRMQIQTNPLLHIPKTWLKVDTFNWPVRCFLSHPRTLTLAEIMGHDDRQTPSLLCVC